MCPTFADVLQLTANSAGDEIEYHLRRGFTPGDKNYEAQFWYARQLYLNGKTADSRELFVRLGDAAVDPSLKQLIRGPITGEGSERFKGQIVRLDSLYALIARDGVGDRVFLHNTNVDEEVWGRLRPSSRVENCIGFTYRGTRAFNLQQ